MPVKKRGSKKSDSGLTEYAEMRQKNLEDNKAVLSKILEEIKEQAPLPKLGTIVKQKKSSRRCTIPGEPRRSLRNNNRYNPLSVSPRITRSRSRRGSVSSETSSNLSSSPEGKFTIRLGLQRRRSGELHDFLEESDDEYIPKRRKSVHVKDRGEIRPPEDITKEELAMVAEGSSNKVYDQHYGTTCHQCRQKTIDMKTICRNKECVGVRGQFCGPCLRNRYGEDVKKALLNAEWICPPCRGNCNCSICRNRQGKSATGILIHLANEYGYSNVSEYLDSLKN